MRGPRAGWLVGLLLSLVLVGVNGRQAAAQSITSARLGVHQPVSDQPRAPFQSVERSGMPRWVKWGLIGAAAGAAMGALLSEADINGDRNAVQNAATGAVFGFAILGGAIAFYDWVCKPDSGSQRAGLC